MNNQQQGPMENLLEGLSQHGRVLSKEDRKAELRARGINVDQFLDEAHSIIAHHCKEERLAWMKIADEKAKRMTADDASLESWRGKNPETILAAFKRFLSEATAQPAIAFRNRTDLTVEDMARILDDHERLQLRSSSQKAPEKHQ